MPPRIAQSYSPEVLEKAAAKALMLFNSFEFLLAFLPLCAVGFFLLAGKDKLIAAAWLTAASLFFYGWWDFRYVPLLLFSILGNFAFGTAIMRSARTPAAARLLTVAVAANLGLLGFFKYADFFIQTANGVSGANLPLLHVVLPLGISFFTFTQIAFLVDAFRREVREYRLVHYALFVTYFPHLIAGPILHHKEMMPQFERSSTYRPRLDNFIVGASIFILGLAKKVLLADSLSPYASALFDRPAEPSALLAWGGVLAYTFQLYFDFSGYSDMAIGLSRIFGVKLPLNFNSPYQARDIADFWRRWHMTLSRFLRDYVYIPLGGNRKGPGRRYANLMATMLLGGLWHGAGWNFVVWGGLHGVYLCLHQLWRWWRPDGPRSASLGRFVTFVAVAVGWVFFRAASLDDATRILYGMAGGHGIAIPAAPAIRLGDVQPQLEALGIHTFLGGGASFVMNWTWVAIAAAIAFFAPNTQQIIALRLRWHPAWAAALGLVMSLCLLSLSRPSEFLYFQF